MPPWNQVTLQHLIQAMDHIDQIGLAAARDGVFQEAENVHMNYPGRGERFYEARPLIAWAYRFQNPNRFLAPNDFIANNGINFLVHERGFIADHLVP